jgi:hypothetical protein
MIIIITCRVKVKNKLTNNIKLSLQITCFLWGPYVLTTNHKQEQTWHLKRDSYVVQNRLFVGHVYILDILEDYKDIK